MPKDAVASWFFILILCLLPNLKGQDYFLTPSGEWLREGMNAPAASFLTIPSDARYEGMASAAVAIASNAHAVYWNAARMVFLPKKREISLQYAPYLRAVGVPDVNYLHLSAIQQTPTYGAWGASLQVFSSGDVAFGIPRPFYPLLNRNACAFTLAHALPITPSLTFGVSGKYIQERINRTGSESFGTRSVAVDLGLAYQKVLKVDKLTIQAGMQIANLGPKMRKIHSSDALAPLPTTLRLGYGLLWNMMDRLSVHLAQDIQKVMIPKALIDNDRSVLNGIFYCFVDAEGGFSEEITDFTFSTGLEFRYKDQYFIRTGIFYEDPQKGNRTYCTIGSGICIKGISIDWAYLLPLQENHPMQGTIRLGLAYTWKNA
ncbi:MAG: PorV/PorQ family protein [Bacteroidota bacterium]